MAKKTKLYVCYGSDCTEPRGALRRLEATLEGVADIKPVKCQKICRGPVVGLKIDGTLEWFRKMDTEKACRRLVTLIETGELKNALVKRRVKARSGKVR